MTTDLPDASAFEDRVDKLSAQRRALLARLQRASPPASPTTAPVKARQAPPPIRRRDRQPPPSPPPAAAGTGGQFEDRLSQLAPSRQALLRALRARQSAMPSPLVPLQPKGDRPPLVCVHAISGSVFAYRSLVGHLDPDQPIFGLEAPGFDGPGAPIDDLPTLASTYDQAIMAHFGDQPITLLGWSMGGVVAYEIARRRHERTGAADPLVLVDAWAPIDQPIPDDRQTLRYYLRELTASTEDVADLDGATFDEVVDDLRRSGRLPADLGTDVARARYTVLRANVRALHTYTPADPHPGPVTQIIPTESDRTFVHWSRLPTPATTTTHTVPGTHYTIWDPPHLPTLATAIGRSLG